MKEFIEDSLYRIVYENVDEFFTLTDLRNPPPTMHEDNKSKLEELRGRTKEKWAYGDDLNQETYLKKRLDRDKGYSLCSEAVKTSLASKEYKEAVRWARTFRKKVSFNDHGFRLSLPKAISGEDKCFIEYKNASRPSVKIAINICGSASVDAESFIKLAKTAIPTIYAIEQAGIATEVWYIAAVDRCHTDCEFPYAVTEVKLKSAQERFNWTTFAPVFTLGSYRESVFTSWTYSKYKVTSGLGRPMDSSTITKLDNLGYTSVIGFNAPGPVKEISAVFDKLFKGKKQKPKKSFV